jgi:hypothetical protein
MGEIFGQYRGVSPGVETMAALRAHQSSVRLLDWPGEFRLTETTARQFYFLIDALIRSIALLSSTARSRNVCNGVEVHFTMPQNGNS